MNVAKIMIEKNINDEIGPTLNLHPGLVSIRKIVSIKVTGSIIRKATYWCSRKLEAWPAY